MSDILCAKCGEPWDSYGITYCIGDGDMTKEEAKKFKQGKGCPICEWGQICTQCKGAKTRSIGSQNCRLCFGRETVTLWQAPDALTLQNSHKWRCNENSSYFVVENPQFVGDQIEESERYHCGTYVKVFFRRALCPECSKYEKEPCEHCLGTGKPTARENDKMNALASLLDASDEDGIDLISEFEF